MTVKDHLASAAWFGLLIGLAEVNAKAAQKFGMSALFDPADAIRRFGFGPVVSAGKDIVWMAPLAGLILALVLAPIIVLIAQRLLRRDALPLIALVFTFLGCLNLLLYPRFHEYAAMLLAGGIAFQTYRIAASRPAAFRRFIQRTTLWVAVVVVAEIVALAGFEVIKERSILAALPAPQAGAPNVLFIVLDTVGTRNLGVYGYERNTTPNLDRLARTSVVFDRALATAPWTLPSHATMFTGRYGHELSTDWKVPLDDAYPTLAEQFTKNGYLTAGFVANSMYCSYEHGLNRGFTRYEDYPVSLGQFVSSLTLSRTILNKPNLRRYLKNDEDLIRQSADQINEKFLRWLPAGKGRPFFAFLNYYDAHDPYLPPPPFDRKFGPGRKDSKWSPLLRSGWDANHNRMITKAEFQEEIDAYDGAIAYLDDRLGVLFDRLRERGFLDNTIIVVTADHGEEFGEHGLYSHGNSLYLPSVHVPLLISSPRIPAGRRISEPVTLRDLAATAAELTGLPFSFPGSSLSRFWASTGTSDADNESPVVNEVRRVTGRPGWLPASKGDMRALVSDGFRYIRNGDGQEELYDFDKDPWEKTNLAERPESIAVLEKLRRQLDAYQQPEIRVVFGTVNAR